MTEGAQVLLPVADHPDTFIFWCPGCKCAHFIDERWSNKGDLVKPTIVGSVLVHGPKEGTGTRHAVRCHSFIRDGKIEYLRDCGHDLAGKTVDMTPP